MTALLQLFFLTLLYNHLYTAGEFKQYDELWRSNYEKTELRSSE